MSRRASPSAFLLLVSVPLGLALLAAVLILVSRLWVEWQWFEQFSRGGVLLRRWLLQIGFSLLGLALGLALQRWISSFWRPGSAPAEPLRFGLAPLAYGLSLGLLATIQLLPLALLLSLAERLVRNPFDSSRLHGLAMLEGLPFPLLLLLAALLGALLLRPSFAPRLVAGMASLAAATAMGRAWGVWSLALLAPDSGIREPLLDADISFALVRFPALAFGLTLLLALVSCHLAAGLWGILARPPQLSDGRFHGFTATQLVRLRAPLALLALLVACGFLLGRHQLLLSTAGSVPGAGWLDVHFVLPLRTTAAVAALLSAVALLLPLPRKGLRGPLMAAVSSALLAVPLLEALLTPLLQLMLVRPRELQLETPYLARSIAATRAAFELDGIRSRNVQPRNRLSRADVIAGQATLRNIRLWDSQPLLSTNRQLQQLRVYYRFSGAAVDRYSLSANAGTDRRQLVMISARELDQASLPPAARTWLNTHLVFTHGYGFTVSPVNTSSPDGLPDFFISDLGASTRVQGNAKLGISSAQVRAGIPIGQPSLYFGALKSPYALAPTKVQEFDYPQGDENLYTHYSGKAGVPIGSAWGRLAASLYLGEPKLLVQGAITPATRLLLRREVRERLRTLAPFVRFEGDPVLVSVQLGQNGPFPRSQHQYWLVEGFTSSRSYPYSAAVPGEPDIRYLRNSVKAVVDAYNGTVVMYVASSSDPIMAGWQRLFPDLFAPMAAMPAALRAHIRYPQWQFELQTAQLLRYHVTDPRVFYSGDDVWQVPKELYGRDQVPVKPYHVSAQLTPDQPAEFLLLQPLTPLARPNLAAWLAARSDDPNYGELVLLRFPTQTPIFGPEQIQALINQNPSISQQFGLWDRAGSEVIQGNLLVVPLGKALLYVEPVYLKARNGGLPTLTRVVVSDGSRVAMETSLDKAIEALLDPRRSLAAITNPAETTPEQTVKGASAGKLISNHNAGQHQHSLFQIMSRFHPILSGNALLVLMLGATSLWTQQPAIAQLRTTPTVSVPDFKNNVTGTWWWQGPVAQDLSSALANELAATGDLKVVERRQLGQVLSEQELAELGIVPKASPTAAKKGQMTGARYIVLGTVTSYDTATELDSKGSGMGFLGFGGSKQNTVTKDYVAIDIRVVDSSSGEIVGSRTVEGRATNTVEQKSSGGSLLPAAVILGATVPMNSGGYAATAAAGTFNFSNNSTTASRTPAAKALRAALIEASGYVSCLLVPVGDCMAEYRAKDQQRRQNTLGTLQLD